MPVCHCLWSATSHSGMCCCPPMWQHMMTQNTPFLNPCCWINANNDIAWHVSKCISAHTDGSHPNWDGCTSVACSLQMNSVHALRLTAWQLTLWLLLGSFPWLDLSTSWLVTVWLANLVNSNNCTSASLTQLVCLVSCRSGHHHQWRFQLGFHQKSQPQEMKHHAQATTGMPNVQ